MKRKQLLNTVCLSVAVLIALSLQWSDLHAARVVHHGSDAAYATDDIRVWLDRDIDIYQPNDVIVFNVQAARDCYATVFAVDTEGYLHVIYPFSRDEDAWLQGGVVYSFTPMYNDIFFSAGARGIAYVFAVASPSPFVYSQYDLGVFAGSWGYRVYGDPFVACRNFYFSLLPPRVVIERVSINFTYFYVREWVRYPRYLCYGTYYGRVHYGYPYQSHYASYCRDYRRHLYDPYSVIGPSCRGPRRGGSYSRVARVNEKHRPHFRARELHSRNSQKPVRMETRQNVSKKNSLDKGIRSKSQRVAGERKDIARRPGTSVTTKSVRKKVTVKHTYRPEKMTSTKKRTSRTVETKTTVKKNSPKSVKTPRTATTSKKAVVKMLPARKHPASRKSSSTNRTVVKKSNQKQVKVKQTTVTVMKDSGPKRQKSAKSAAVKKGSTTKTSSKSKSRR